jgi:hypothetical protein
VGKEELGRREEEEEGEGEGPSRRGSGNFEGKKATLRKQALGHQIRCLIGFMGPGSGFSFIR